MAYKFALEHEHYGDYASGWVFYNLPGHPAFPIRLASEVFQRCMRMRAARGLDGPVRLYDPCCGGAYHLAVLAYLHWEEIGAITASDIDAQAVAIAQRNLALLTPSGLQRRITEIEEMQRLYGKASHDEARQSAQVLQERLLQLTSTHPIAPVVFQADALQGEEMRARLAGRVVDLVISDIPYGIQSHWELSTAAGRKPPVWLLLENLRGILAEEALVTIASAKQERIAHEAYRQVGKLKVGKRQVVFLMKNV